MNIIKWIEALKENPEIWKVGVPIFLGVLIIGAVAGLAIDLALSAPIVFLAWSITCFVAGLAAHRWLCKPTEPQAPSGGWTSS
jgi:hypothetical protein